MCVCAGAAQQAQNKLGSNKKMKYKNIVQISRGGIISLQAVMMLFNLPQWLHSTCDFRITITSFIPTGKYFWDKAPEQEKKI